MYASLRSSLTSRLHSVIGARYSDYEYKFVHQQEHHTTGAADQQRQPGLRGRDNEFVPYGGLTFDVTDAISVTAASRASSSRKVICDSHG